METAYKRGSGRKLKLLVWVLVLLAVAALAVTLVLPRLQQAGQPPEIITVSTLQEIVNVSRLSTYTAVYNGIAQVMNPDKPEETDYYVSYEAKVYAGIDFDRVQIRVDNEAKMIYVEIPEVDITKVNVDIASMDFIFYNDKANTATYGNPEATHQDIVAATKASSIHHFIESLPHGYRTQISEDSDNISAGEKQLLTIARAMVANPPMMILDEATSNVDTRTEQLIQDAFVKLTRGRTSFVIAHRLSTVRDADTILVLDHGRIVGKGSHAELLETNAPYQRLVAASGSEDCDLAAL